jgi:uncharacterized membrane protein
MMPASLVTFLRLAHIVVGVCWVGAVVFIAVFLLPTVKAVGPTGGAVMQELTQVRRLPSYLMAGVVLTILSGLALYWNDSAGFSGPWMSSGPGRTFGLGAALALVTGIIGMVVNAPTARRIGRLGAAIRESGTAPTAEQGVEMRRLQSRLTTAMNVAAVLLLLATAAMSVARYMP